MSTLQGKTVLVTGASSGIGEATAIAFAREGCRLLVCARRLDKLEALKEKLTDAPEVHVFELDVQDGAAVARILSGLPQEWQQIDILVNNAGLSRGLNKLYEDDPKNWQEMIDTNVLGLLQVTRAVVPGMVNRGSGHVINIGSTAGHQTYAGGAVYCASKAAEKAITEGLRIDVIGKGIRVTSVDPGMVETDFSAVRFHGDQEKASKVYQDMTPLKAEDIANTIVWVASRPDHVQIQMVIITPTDQANSTTIHRQKK